VADQLTDFLRDRKRQATPLNVDWEAKKADRLESVGRLYHLLRDLLRGPIHDQTVEIAEVPIEVTEDYVGAYRLPELRLTVGNDRVVFCPKGINVIGAAGRVDLRGDRDTVTLLRVLDNGREEWQVVLQRVPRFVAVPLEQGSLRTALQRVMLP